MRKHLERLKRRSDAGVGIAATMIGFALAAVILGGGIAVYTQLNQAAQVTGTVQEQSGSVDEALNRTSQDIQVADPIIVAAENHLVVASTDNAGDPIRTRWIRHDGTFYQQVWTDFTGEYDYSSNQWINPTTGTGTAPSGDGQQLSRPTVENVTGSNPIFAYFDDQGDPVNVGSPLTAENGATAAIKRVEVTLESATLEGETVISTTSAAPRNATGGVADGLQAAPMCPALTFQGDSSGHPILEWGTIAGANSYVIERNSAQAGTVSVPDTSARGTWTDTGYQPSSGEAVTYSVRAVGSDGQTSQECRPAVWRAQLETPVFTNTTVDPTSTSAAGWNSTSLNAPRISVRWSQVDGASSYALFYRPVNPSTGAPLQQAFIEAAVTGPSDTDYIWDGGGWGKRYEWYVIANARSGQSSESAHVQTLTHPLSPTGATVSATYGYGSDKPTRGRNVISWDAAPTASAYEVWRYPEGSTTGSATRIAVTTARTAVDVVPYGTKYSYYVVSRNWGPRGTNSAGTNINGYRYSPTPEATANTSPQKVTQLQYPPTPSIKGVSTSSGYSRDLSGYNRFSWWGAQSATGYHVSRANVGAGTSCLTGNCGSASGGTTSTTKTDSAPLGSQRDYRVRAYNGTGFSVAYSSTARITQRPAAPVLTVTARPTPTQDDASFSIRANADSNAATSSGFCTSSSCSYELREGGSRVRSLSHTTKNAVLSFNDVAINQNAVTTFEARSHNAALSNGGWSDMASASVVSSPEVGNSSIYPNSAAASSWATSSFNTLSTPKTIVRWESIEGAAGYQIYARPVDPDTNSATGSWARHASVGSTSTSWTDTYVPWASRYEYFVRVAGPGGITNDSSRFKIQAHPQAPGSPDVTPHYGYGSRKGIDGRNIVSWASAPTASSYEVYRYPEGSTSGTATRIATTTARTLTDVVDYGTKYTYYVVAKNYGPRGTTSTGSETSATRTSAVPESSASSEPAKLTQLQYPPTPGIKPVTTSGTNTRDYDGYNRIRWGSARSASGYFAWRINPGDQWTTCITSSCSGTSGGTGSTYLDDHAPVYGSQFLYAVRAYNSTGVSPELSAKVLLTQRPATPDLKVTNAPDLSSSNTSFSIAANGDNGNNSANAFCTSSSCEYQLIKNGSSISTQGHPSGSTVSWSTSNGHGGTYTYQARAKNQALTHDGWSDRSTETIKTYPGAFSVNKWIGDYYQNNKGHFEARFDNYANDESRDVDGNLKTSDQRGYATVSWGASSGADTMTIKRVDVAYESRSSDSSLGLPSTNDPVWSRDGSAYGYIAATAAPGATYKYYLTATAPNGLERGYESWEFTTPADPPSGGTMMVVCSNVSSGYIHGTRLINISHKPRYGYWNKVQIDGLHQPAKGYSLRNSGYDKTYYRSSGDLGDLTNGNGQPFWSGSTSGFNIQAHGTGLSSFTVQLIFINWGKYSPGCGTGTRGSMREPTYACYNDFGCNYTTKNRPKYWTR